MGNKLNIMAMIKRIKTSQDGIDFIEYLENLSIDNYKSFIKDDSEMNDIHKGYGMAIDNLINLFKECDKEEQTPSNIPWA